MQIERLVTSDIPSLAALTPTGWRDITMSHELYLSDKMFRPIKSLDSEQIVGLGTAISYSGTGWLAHIIVSEGHRGNGIGRTMVENLLLYLEKECGCRSVSLIASDMGLRLYEKVGFAVQSRYVELISEQDIRAPLCRSDKIKTLEHQHARQIFELDYLASGERRNKLLERYFSNGLVYLQDDVILGYYLPDLFEGLIIAKTETAGTELLKVMITNSKRVILPEENKAACQFLLQQYGFVETGKGMHRMIYGDEFPRRPDYVYNRIGGFAG